jgi:hypothetical protein
MKYTCSVTICDTKKSGCHITVSDGDSEFRVYAGRNTVARVVGGVVGKFWARQKKNESAPTCLQQKNGVIR